MVTTADYLEMTSIASTEAVFTNIRFDKLFFDRYQSTIDQPFSGKLLLKPFLNCVRLDRSKEKAPDSSEERASFKVENDRIIVDVSVTPLGIQKNFSLHYQETIAMKAIYDSSDYCNTLIGSSKLFLDVIQSFPKEVDQISLEFQTDSFTMSTFSESNEISNIDNRLLTTKITVDLEDFSHYECLQEMILIFNLKDFRKILLFADGIGTDLTLKVKGPGSALIIEYQPFENVSIDFVLATLFDPDWIPKNQLSQDKIGQMSNNEEIISSSPKRNDLSKKSLFSEMKSC